MPVPIRTNKKKKKMIIHFRCDRGPLYNIYLYVYNIVYAYYWHIYYIKI